MSKSAQLAQKSKFSIGGTGGAAKNITAVAVGFPTIITSSAHGFSNGDVVTFASITGTVGTDSTNGLNGKTLVIKNVTTNTFCVEVNTTSLAYTSGGTGTPATWTQVKEIKKIGKSSSKASTIDVTDLDSDAKEFRTGLIDNGAISLELNDLVTDPGQQAMLAAFTASTVIPFKVELTGGSVRSFFGSVTGFDTVPDAAVDGVQTISAEIKISGAVTRS